MLRGHECFVAAVLSMITYVQSWITLFEQNQFVQGVGYIMMSTNNIITIVTLFFIPTFNIFNRRGRLEWSVYTMVSNAVLALIYVFIVLPSPENFVINAADLKSSILACFFVMTICSIFAIYISNMVGHAYEEVKRTNETIESNTREKEEFFAAISHEIRNPLQSLQGSVDLVAELRKTNPAQLDADLLPLLEICRGCCGIVINMVSNILDMSKIAADKMQLSPAPTDLRELINRVIRTSRGRAEGKNIVLRLDCDSLFPPAIEVDPQRIEQVLVNLVSNSIKFTSAHGRIVIKASWLQRSAGVETALAHSSWKESMELSEEAAHEFPAVAAAVGPPLTRALDSRYLQTSTPSKRMRRVRTGLSFRTDPTVPAGPRPSAGVAKIEVMDTGIGMSKEGVAKLFKPYQQADSSISRFVYLP